MKTFEINIKFHTEYLRLKYPEFRVFVDNLLPSYAFEITKFLLNLDGTEGLAEITWISNGTISYNKIQELVEEMFNVLVEANAPILNLEILNV